MDYNELFKDMLFSIIEAATDHRPSVETILVAVQAMVQANPTPVHMEPLDVTLNLMEAAESPEFLRGFATMAAIAMMMEGGMGVITNALLASVDRLTQARIDVMNGRALQPKH